ncbi:3'-5' exoribonuclease YhaM family protein [Isachenkonia alkalipeptolytica]|uniref:3'-5' exoribonuclease YhaM family protein n=1 Tax=Isachenkonia alkalipeptolytica TaxID=2565777 RepID=UPI00191BE3D6|nr:HD domain-containing protein [Isachenkonia alkalipeptolytica]
MQLKEITKEHLNEVLEFVVLISDVRLKKTKTDKVYADLTVQDASKIMEVKCWDYEKYQHIFEEIEANDPVEIKGAVGEYNGQLQLTVKEVRKLPKGEYQVQNLIPTSTWDYEDMEKGLRVFYEKIETPEFQQLLDALVFSEAYYEKFMTYPAAKKVHHNFYHGILQHTLEVLKYSLTVAKTKKLSQRQIDRLMVIAFLHDWAKIKEYAPLPKNDLTDEGIMLGHIFLGSHEVLNTINTIDGFREEDKLIILNGLLGHHGALEWGSPVLPKTIEAQILHQADKLSGDIESILSFVDENQDEESFTPKLWNMGTGYYKK